MDGKIFPSMTLILGESGFTGRGGGAWMVKYLSFHDPDVRGKRFY